ncbi:Acyl-CoA dehydrogenase, short-chain specific [Candidatus Rhodobacter oscarellae]|uniref:3-sulfinopropanoyl-CoA desulfinase n=1 Tax=Candidatus Rhodobacter oscarellae TaxID=1675527 RepID=A0A0J9E4D3_9RHOB|nr:3-sulfinopropanoyl-CoA desulfinase [Candidatus Rhodobacter lobularis]KMW57626.1 Acyl-CoA dehydrogenase, short-chain specific [Candidatus Rhodobacter lobularis]
MLDQTRYHHLNQARALAPVFAERAARWDQNREYCWDNIRDLADAGLMGMTIPPRFGGAGASYFEVVQVVEEIARACTLTARVVVEANMGGISAVMAYGTDEQRAYCAPLVLAGDKPAICITEPQAGSAATEMQTTARRVAAGYVLDGCKHWITGGGVSKLYLIFARVLDEDGAEEGITGFLVHHDPATGHDPKGFEVVRRERTMGLCGMPEAELRFADLMVEDRFVLRPPAGFKRGFADLMSAYNSQRVGAGTIAMGVAAGALEHAKRYLAERHQFGRPLQEFQGLQWMLADMDAAVHASRLMLQEAAKTLGPLGFPDMLMAARAKAFASEQAIKVVSDALQMFGARGYGDQEPLERMYRDVRMFTIGGGTAQILKTQVAGALLGIKTPQTRDGYAQTRSAR